MRTHALADFARAGFRDLSGSRDATIQLSESTGIVVTTLLEAFEHAADPDAALSRMTELVERHPHLMQMLDDLSWQRLAMLLGASPAFGTFFLRRPDRLVEILQRGGRLIGVSEAKAQLLEAVRAKQTLNEAIEQTVMIAARTAEDGATALRVRYRELLAELMLFDLHQAQAGQAPEAFDCVAASLSALADAALESALAIARGTVVAGVNAPAVAEERVVATRFAILALGKCGAEELNVVSDVDVMFIAEPAANDADAASSVFEDANRIGTRLATETMRAIHDPGIEPPLWQVDANLRPEGKQGALVRSLGSMLNYYERWAKTWEFQALLKARAVAGDLVLGQEFVDRTRAMVWASADREDFVGSVQRMRERVTEHIDAEDLDYQIKLGPGGLRDIEFSVQLLQLVHGQHDERLRSAGTLPALQALVAGGYVAREDGELLAADYRRLRVLEHRLQLRDLRRTALMPRDDESLRVLARSSQLAMTAEALHTLWQGIRTEVRSLHMKIFYAPLLNAVAALPGDDFKLGGDEARARLHSIGFRDADGAMRHLAALTKGSSRAAKIQRNLLPVLLPWLAAGTDPDYGLLAFRRVSDASAATPWYLRLLRDGSEAAERLMRVLSTSKFAAELLETIPEAVAWLERDELLQPVSVNVLLEEMRALASRRSDIASAAEALRAVHRREVLRLALGRIVFVNDDEAVARGLDAAHTALLDGLLMALRAQREYFGSEQDRDRPDVEIALIAMGRFGGQELGFASDLDLLAVFRVAEDATSEEAQRAKQYAERLITELRTLVGDPRFTVDLDFDLRPEGKNGPIIRSLDSYRSYYKRWSLTWEAQALLRARTVAGDKLLGAAFTSLADEIRYPLQFGEDEVREVRRVKARVEGERLPRGEDPRRHLKLGPGGLSDVEWLVQLLQLKYGAKHEGLRTQSTLGALTAAVAAGELDQQDQQYLESSWKLASRIRSAIKLWSDRSSDVLPIDRMQLEGIGGVLGMARAKTSELEEQWFAASRRARAVFEREFFGFDDDLRFPTI